MSNDLIASLTLQVAKLHGRATEINRRIQRDAELLTAVQQELSEAMSSLTVIAQRAPVRVPVAPRSPSVLRLVDVSKRIGLSRSTVWQMTKDGQFPSPRKLSGRAVGWLETEVTEWVNSREVASARQMAKPRRRQD